jgi:hypothetical protein
MGVCGYFAVSYIDSCFTEYKDMRCPPVIYDSYKCPDFSSYSQFSVCRSGIGSGHYVGNSQQDRREKAQGKLTTKKGAAGRQRP